mmetsp:Transcript_95077/g.271891  ORF Transcript_95077/g.271891 Transcript_95077/m.271891 type:complete len:209 (-) Transcript_95077:449-1075(-)
MPVLSGRSTSLALKYSDQSAFRRKRMKRSATWIDWSTRQPRTRRHCSSISRPKCRTASFSLVRNGHPPVRSRPAEAFPSPPPAPGLSGGGVRTSFCSTDRSISIPLICTVAARPPGWFHSSSTAAISRKTEWSASDVGRSPVFCTARCHESRSPRSDEVAFRDGRRALGPRHMVRHPYEPAGSTGDNDRSRPSEIFAGVLGRPAAYAR